MGYIKEIDTWNRGRFLRGLFEKPSNKEQKDFIITMLQIEQVQELLPMKQLRIIT